MRYRIIRRGYKIYCVTYYSICIFLLLYMYSVHSRVQQKTLLFELQLHLEVQTFHRNSVAVTID